MISVTLSPWVFSHRLVVGATEEFAVGDVHGHADLLEAVLETVARLAGGRPSTRLTYLGDLIDRGPDSRRCLELAARSARDHGVGAVHRLMGNHEQMMRLFMEGHPCLFTWCANGGGAALNSFGIDMDEVERALARKHPSRSGWMFEAALQDDVRDRLAAVVPAPVTAMLSAMTGHRRVGKTLFVHAGIDPRTDPFQTLQQPWDALVDHHWAWIREPFLSHRAETFAEDLLVVHGHTPEPEVLDTEQRAPGGGHRLRCGRLNLDAGSYCTGRVAASQLCDGRYRLIVARRCADSGPEPLGPDPACEFAQT